MAEEPKVVEAEDGVWVIGGSDAPAADSKAAAGGSKGAGKGGGYSDRSVPAAPAPGAEEKTDSSEATPGTKKATNQSSDPSIATLMFGSKTGEPQAEHFIVHFQQHLEPVLKQMALDVGAKWLAAGGHTGQDANPDKEKAIADPIMQQTSADAVFKDVFKAGFALECLEAITGPPSPMILFKFRHAGQFTNNAKYVDHDGTVWEGKGQMIETEGMCHALKLPGMNMIQKVDIYYNHSKPIKAIADPESATNGACPMSGKEGMCPLMG